MDDDEYLNNLVDKASESVVKYGWYDCVEGFKQADVDMGSAFHRKLEWMNKAAGIYLSDNNKMAGFVGKFSDDCGIGPDYGSRLNRIRKAFPLRRAENFSHNTLEVLLSAPEELREEIVSSGKPVTVAEVKEAKEVHKEIQDTPEFKDLKQSYEDKELDIFDVVDEVKTRKASMPVVPSYNINEAMGAIKGIAQMYGQQYSGTTKDAAQVLLDKVMEGHDTDDIGLSIARDYAKWFLSLRSVIDLVGPELEDFLSDKPNLTVVN